MRKCRIYQVEIQLFNSIASDVIFMQKLVFITMAVLGIFITIGFGHEVPVVVTAVNAFMAAVGIFLYNFMYDAAVWMPSRFEELKRSIFRAAMNSNRSRDTFRMKVYRRRLKAVPIMRVHIGNFHSFSNTTTLEFVDFVTQKVCSLLLAFC